jgi:serine protease Do
LEAGDVVTAVDGKPVVTSQELKDEIREKKIGQNVTLAVSRLANEAVKQLKISVKMRELPDKIMLASNSESNSAHTNGSGNLGFTVKALTKDLADELNIEMTEGVVVSSVERNGLAARVDIKPGDIVTKVNRHPVANPKQFREVTKALDTKNGVIVNVISGGTARFEILKDGEE